jgi:hypothetical protein
MESNVVLFVILVFGFSFVIMNYFIYNKVLKLVIPISKKGMTATGTLIRIDRVRKGKSVAFYPVVKYKTLTGRNYECRTILSSKISKIKLNESVEIIYNPDIEDHFMIQKYFNIKYYYFIFVFMNLMTIGMLLFFLLNPEFR